MKPWIRRTLLGLFGASIALGALTACGHRYERHGWNASPEEHARWRGKVLERVASKLELNGEQKAKLAVAADKLHAQRTALRGATDPRAEVQKLVAGEKFDRARAQALVAEKTAAVTSMSPEVIAALADFYDSLNPQQQAKVREFMERRRGWWHRHHG
jgi:Spy/CpxP family protein refolding chaperone